MSFLTATGAFKVDFVKSDGSSYEYALALKIDTEQELMAMSRDTLLTKNDNAFFHQYTLTPLENKAKFYYYSGKLHGLGDSQLDRLAAESHVNGDRDDNLDLSFPNNSTLDYSNMKLADLRSTCRERGFKVSGSKAILIQRLQTSAEELVVPKQVRAHLKNL